MNWHWRCIPLAQNWRPSLSALILRLIYFILHQHHLLTDLQLLQLYVSLSHHCLHTLLDQHWCLVPYCFCRFCMPAPLPHAHQVLSPIFGANILVVAFLHWYGAGNLSLPTVASTHAVSFPLHHPDGGLPAPLSWRTIGVAPGLLTACPVITLFPICLSVVTPSPSLYTAHCSTCTSSGSLPVWTSPEQCVFCQSLVWLVTTCMASVFWLVFPLPVLGPVCTPPLLVPVWMLSAPLSVCPPFGLVSVWPSQFPFTVSPPPTPLQSFRFSLALHVFWSWRDWILGHPFTWYVPAVVCTIGYSPPPPLPNHLRTVLPILPRPPCGLVLLCNVTKGC